MRRMLVVGMLVAALVSSVFAKGKGATLDLDVKQAPLADLLRLISDVSKANIVTVGTIDAKLDATYKSTPWDDVLADLLARAKLASVRDGNVYLVGDAAKIAARKKAKRPAYKGKTIALDVRNADSAAIAALLSRLGPAVELVGGSPATLRLKNVPLDQATDVIVFATGATSKPGTPATLAAPGTCKAAGTAIRDLTLVGIGRSGTQRLAAFARGGQVVVISATDCLGSDKLTVKDLADASVTFAGEIVVPLHPAR